MSRIVRVSALQLPTVIEGRSFAEKQRKNFAVVRSMLAIAGRRKSDLVLFGEYANLHHRTWSDNRKELVPDPIPGAFVRGVARIARQYRMNVALPILGTLRGEMGNFVVLLNRQGKIVGCYQKSHPTLPEQENGIRPGNDLPVFALDCARVGIMTCMDIEYPEVAQVLMLKGAEILLFPHVQGTWGEVDWEIRYRSRAIDTGLPVVSACYGYEEGAWRPGKMIGRTSVIGRDGLIVADMGRSIGVLTVDLDLDRKRLTEFFFLKQLDRSLAVAASRRPELYHDLTEMGIKIKALAQVQARLPGRRTREERST
jgi:predicted amidohydrolase